MFKISGSKTELCFLAKTANSNGDVDDVILHILKPFSKKVTKAYYPFDPHTAEKDGCVFINEQYLLIGHGDRILGVETKKLFEEGNEFVF